MRIGVIALLITLAMLNRAASFAVSGLRFRAIARGFRGSAMRAVADTRDGSTRPGKEGKGPVPITVLSGFLGAGKTSFLSNTLANRGNTKFGLVVNDMATVNVDAKQIRQQTMDPFGGIDTMELQDGCVCCTLAEDMIASVSKLITLSDLKKERYDHLVVECSGIAEPRKIRDLFQQAEDYKLELLKKVRLDTLVTLVDATVFLELFGTDEKVAAHKHLAYRKEQAKRPQDPNDQNTYIELDGSEQRAITDLLLEQVECADVVLINKCDLLSSPADIDLVKKVVTSINPMARVMTCVNGVVPDPLEILGSAQAKGAADWGVLDEHRKLIAAVDAGASQAAKDETEECHVQNCQDPSHGHHHGHSHEHHASHSHKHDHSHSKACQDRTCTDPSHSHDHTHSHSHNHSHDHSHGHSHSHDHSSSNPDMTTAEREFGITSFVYRRRRPFHPVRFSILLSSLGKLSVKGVSDMAGIADSVSSGAEQTSAQAVTAAKDSAALSYAKRALLRSKGFVWMSTSAQAAYFMSHAGQYLELLALGRWWAAIDKAQWPTAALEDITVDFAGPHGDRRQELVFIGQFAKDGGTSQRALEEVLDQCLLTDAEMKEYDAVAQQGDDALRDHFAPPHVRE